MRRFGEAGLHKSDVRQNHSWRNNLFFPYKKALQIRLNFTGLSFF